MLHTLWHREHNLACSEILAENPVLADEEVFQRARALTIAKYQAGKSSFTEMESMALAQTLQNSLSSSLSCP